MSSLPSRAVAALRAAAVVTAGAALLIALIVLGVAGHHAAGLGADPTWALGYGMERVDIWADARRRYQLLARGALLVWMGAWVAIGLIPGLGRVAPRDGAPPRGRRLMRVAPWLLGPVFVGVLWGNLQVTGFSIPALVAACCTATTAACLLGAVWMRGPGIGAGAAWLLSGAVVLGGAVGGSVLTALLLVAAAMGGLEVEGPLTGLLVLLGLTPAFGISALLLRRALRRWTEDDEDPASPAAASSAAPTAAAPVPASALAPAEATARTGLLLATPLVLALALVAVLVSRPVSSPDRDAEAPLVPVPATIAEVSADPDASAEEPAEDPQPARIGASSPACTADQLQLRAGDWDLESATLEARNISTETCALRGRPALHLAQGGQEVALEASAPVGEVAGLDPATTGALLPAGGVATSHLEWAGAGDAADRETPQRLTLRTDDGGTVPVAILAYSAWDESFAGQPGSRPGTGVDEDWGDPPAAPLDLDVAAQDDGTAAIRAGLWTPLGKR